MLTVWPQVATRRVAGLWHKRQSRPATEFIAWLGGNGSWLARGFEAFELFGLVEINFGLVGFALLFQRESQVVVCRPQLGMDAERLRELFFGSGRVVQCGQDDAQAVVV